MSSALSDFDRLQRERLPNWRRWGAQDKGRPDPESVSSGVYGNGKRAGVVVAYQCATCLRWYHEAGMCKACDKELRRIEEQEPPPDPPPVIDAVDAAHLEHLISRLPDEHKHVIARFYGTFGRPPDNSVRPRLPAAIRALLDAEYELERWRA